MEIWRIIEHFVKTGQESRKVELKHTLELKTKPQRAEFAKDIMAMANTPGGPGYIIIGVVDARHRTTDDPTDYVVGFDHPDPDAFQRLMVQALEYYARPVPEVEFHITIHPEVNRPIGVIRIPRSFARPHRVAVAGEGLPREAIFIRRGAETCQATFEEIQRMIEGSKKGWRILVNFSGRSITEEQCRQVEKLTGNVVDEIINVEAGLDMNLPFEPQIEKMVWATGLTRSEWESLPLLIHIHALAPAAALLLARLHGLCGGFPDILRMRENPPGSRNWEVFEILRLQEVRNRAWQEGRGNYF